MYWDWRATSAWSMRSGRRCARPKRRIVARARRPADTGIHLPHAKIVEPQPPVVGKAEYLTKGENPRFVVTSRTRRAAAKRLYEKLYCARGDMENRIKEPWPVRRPHQRANDAREPVASVLLLLRLCVDAVTSSTGAQGTELEKSPPWAEAVEGRDTDPHYGPRVWLSFSQAYPYARVFAEVLANLQREPLWREPG